MIKFTDVLDTENNAIPCVYGVYHNSTLIYVGQTKRLGKRLQEHRTAIRRNDWHGFYAPDEQLHSKVLVICDDESTRLLIEFRLHKQIGSLLNMTNRNNGKTKLTSDGHMKMSKTKSSGIWVTPFGNYHSSKDVFTEHGIPYSTVLKRCRNPDKVVSRESASRSKDLTMDSIGKTFGELGWNFIPKREGQ